MFKVRETKRKRFYAIALATLFVLVMGISIFLFFHRVDNQQMSYLSGDEPDYVMLTQSLIKTGSFNLKPGYIHDWSKSYYPGPSLLPQLTKVSNLNSSQWYSIHTVGLPLLLVIPFKLWGVIGARVWVMLIQLAVIPIFYLILKKYTKSSKRAIFGVTILLSCSLFWQNFGAIFPDLILVTLWGLMIILFDKASVLLNCLFMLTFILAELVHTKGIALMAPLVLLNIYYLVRKYDFKVWLKKYWLPMAILVIGNLIYITYLHAHYGSWTPLSLYKGSGQLFGTNPVTNTIAIITDRNKGLLIYFPLVVIAGPYIYRAVCDIKNHLRNTKGLKSPHQFLVIGVVLGSLASLITQITFEDWSGSVAPNGRDVLPLVFLLIFIVVKYLNPSKIYEVVSVGILSVIDVVITVIAIVEIKFYISPGVNSFLVTRYQYLKNLPIFPQDSMLAPHQNKIEGLYILLAIVIFNVLLIILFNSQKETLKPATSLKPASARISHK